MIPKITTTTTDNEYDDVTGKLIRSVVTVTEEEAYLCPQTAPAPGRITANPAAKKA